MMSSTPASLQISKFQNLSKVRLMTLIKFSFAVAEPKRKVDGSATPRRWPRPPAMDEPGSLGPVMPVKRPNGGLASCYKGQSGAKLCTLCIPSVAHLGSRDCGRRHQERPWGSRDGCPRLQGKLPWIAIQGSFRSARFILAPTTTVNLQPACSSVVRGPRMVVTSGRRHGA